MDRIKTASADAATTAFYLLMLLVPLLIFALFIAGPADLAAILARCQP